MALTAQDVVNRMRSQVGSGWIDTPVDAIMAGNGSTEVKGIATTYAPSIDVLQKAVASEKNMIISRESPYWARTNAAGGGTQFSGVPGNWKNGPDFARQEAGAPEGDPVYKAKAEYIAANNLVFYRLFANWNAQAQDMQLQALAKALGWEKGYKPSGGHTWAPSSGFFELTATTLKNEALKIKTALNIKSMRLGGDPNAQVRKAALSHGMSWLPDIRRLCAEPGVDLLVIGEPQWENELSLYAFDRINAGLLKGYIVLGQERSEEPGCAQMANWLQSFMTGVPVAHISTGEPCWTPAETGRMSI